MANQFLDLTDVEVDLEISEDHKRVSFTVESDKEISVTDFIRIVQMVLSVTDAGGPH